MFNVFLFCFVFKKTQNEHPRLEDAEKDTIYRAETDTSLNTESTRVKFDLAFLQYCEN